MSINIAPLDIVALYGALLSTCVAGWNIYQKWTAGPKLAVKLIANQRFAKGFFDEAKTYIFIAIANRGNAETTITGLNLFAYKNLVRQLRNRGKQKIVEVHCMPNVSLPYRLGCGCEFDAFIVQDTAVEEWSKKHQTFLFVSHSMSNKPFGTRLSPIEPLRGEE